MYFDENDPYVPHCRGCEKADNTVEERFDFYGMSTGYWCDKCYKDHYPYRKDAYYDPAYAGERMDDDY